MLQVQLHESFDLTSTAIAQLSSIEESPGTMTQLPPPLSSSSSSPSPTRPNDGARAGGGMLRGPWKRHETAVRWEQPESSLP